MLPFRLTHYSRSQFVLETLSNTIITMITVQAHRQTMFIGGLSAWRFQHPGRQGRWGWVWKGVAPPIRGFGITPDKCFEIEMPVLCGRILTHTKQKI